VEGVELWSGTESLSVLAKQNLRRCSRINYNNRNISQLYLINSTICASPLSVLLGGVLSNLPQIAYQRKTLGSSKTDDTSLTSDNFIDNNVENWDHKEGHSQ
jgi:hypothetical protein